MKLPTLKDSRDRESTTLMLVALSWSVINFRFLMDMFDKGTITLTEYATSVGAVLLIWLGREWQARSGTEKKT